MASSDNLSKVQFWDMDQVGQLNSGNRQGMTVSEEYENRHTPEGRANDERRASAKGFRNADEYRSHLKNHMAEHGLVNPPTYRDDGDGNTLTSGFHRYAAARDLGWKQLPIRPWAGGDSQTSKPVKGFS